MARIDKTDSAVGVVRGVLNADLDLDSYEDGLLGVGINSTGKVVPGAGQTGVIAVINPSRFWAKAGRPADLFVLGDFVDIGLGENDPDLDAGKAVYADNTTGELSHTAAGGTYVGYTVEADHLILALGGPGSIGGGGSPITPQAAPAAAAVPFADLTAAANAHNALRTALIASGVLTA